MIWGTHFIQLTNEHSHILYNWRLYIFCKVSPEGGESPGQPSGAITSQPSRLLPPSPSGFCFSINFFFSPLLPTSLLQARLPASTQPSPSLPSTPHSQGWPWQVSLFVWFFVCFPTLHSKRWPWQVQCSGSTIVICALIFSFRRPREKTMLPCSVCGKTFDRPSLLKRHMRTHTGEKPHICNICNKGFSTSSSLNTHRWVKSEKVGQC